nr:annexin A9 isoform X2 [Equus caballus]
MTHLASLLAPLGTHVPARTHTHSSEIAPTDLKSPAGNSKGEGQAAAHCTMSVTSGKTGPSLTQEILSHLGLASKDLLQSLQAALSGSLERIVVALLQPAARFDAQQLRTALKDSSSAEDVAMEILATRTPPQLQECLAFYKHGRTWRAWAPRAERGSTGQSSPLALPTGEPSGSLSAQALFPWSLPPNCPKPHPPASRAQSPQGREPDVVIKEREAVINHLSLGLRGRFRSNDNVGHCDSPTGTMASSQPLADSAITPHPGLNGTLLQPRGKVGTCSISDFQMEAEEDIKSKTSGILQDLLLALAKGRRESYCGIIDYNLAEQDVQALKRAEGPTTKGTWVLVFTQRNPEHLVRVFHQYQRDTGHELEKTVRHRFHRDAQGPLLSLASVIRNTPLYFADKLHRALQETEPNYQVLMRILVSRSETDLLSIRAEFKKKFGKSLYSSLQDAVKGDCRSALLALCRAEDI